MTWVTLSTVKKNLLLLGILLVFILFLFRDILLNRHFLFGSDFVAFYLGMKQFLFTEIHTHHSLPFWNPYIYSGMPYWAHFESTIFYPLGFLFWLISPERAFGFTVLFHLLLGCVLMHLLSKSFFSSPWAGFVASAVFVLNNFLMATLYDGQMHRVFCYVWIPLILYLLNKALNSPSLWFYGSLAGAAWGAQILAGAPQDAFYTFLAASLFLAWNLKRPLKSARHNPRVFLLLVLLFCFGSGLAAIQLLPAFEFMDQSVRASLGRYDLITQGSYPPEALITAFLPRFFGNYVNAEYWVSGVPWSIPFYNLYVGILPLFLLLFLTRDHSGHGRILGFSVSLALIALVLALGSHTPVYQWVSMLPGFDKIRAPAKIIMLWAFAMALLAGKGMDDLLRMGEKSLRRRGCMALCCGLLLAGLNLFFLFDPPLVLRVFSPFILAEAIPSMMSHARDIILSEFYRMVLISLFLVLLFFVLIRLRRHRSRSFILFLMSGILVLDLGHVNWGAVRYKDEVYDWTLQAKTGLESTIGKDRELYRVGSFEFGMGPNIEMVMGYQTVGGYTPFFLHRYYEYINSYTEGRLPEAWVYFFYGRHPKTRLMDLLNLKYEILYDQGSYTIRSTGLPRAFLVPGHDVVERSEVLSRLTHPDFDPKKTVLFEKEEEPLGLRPQASPEPAPPGLARILSYRPDRLAIETDSPAFRYLFLSEIFYPGWKAFIDGQPTRILRGNYLFRVLELPEGRHQVRLEFDPWTIKAGTGITLLTAAMILAMLVFRRLKRKAPRS
jgi:hypothetical protein